MPRADFSRRSLNTASSCLHRATTSSEEMAWVLLQARLPTLTIVSLTVSFVGLFNFAFFVPFIPLVLPRSLSSSSPRSLVTS